MMGLHVKSADIFDRLQKQIQQLLETQPKESLHPSRDISNLIRDLEQHQINLDSKIEELTRGQQETARMLKEYEDLYEFAPCGYLTLDAHRIIKRINRSGEEILENDRRSLIGSNFDRCISPAGDAGFLDACEIALETGDTQYVEIPLTRKKKSGAWVRLAIRAALTANEAMAGWRIMFADITVQKQAEESLIENQSFIQSIIDCADIAIFARDAKGQYILANQYHANLLHSSPAEVVGRKNVDFEISKFNAKDYAQNDQYVWQTGHALQFEEVVHQSDGDHIYMSYKYPLRDADGNMYAMCGIATDITERKRLEEELELRVKERTASLAQLEAKYRALVENTMDIPFRIDASGRMRYVGPQAKRYGLDPNALEGRHMLDIMFPEDRDRVASVFNKSIASGTTTPTEFRIPTPDGRIIWFEEQSTQQRDVSGKIMGFTGVLRDVTERKHYENVLRESEERYRSLFEAESDAILVFDAQTRQFVDVNPAAEKMYGYTHDEFLNLKHSDITCEPQASDESIKQILMGTLKEAILQRWHRKKDGSVFPIEFAPNKYTVNGRTMLCGIVRDITARMQAEKQRDKRQKRLQRLSARLARAQDEEQRRIAEGLHDDVAQDLALCNLKLALLDREKDPAEINAIRHNINELIQNAVEKIRSLSFELLSSSLYKAGFKDAIGELCHSMSIRYGVRFTVESDDDRLRLEDTTAIVLFKAVRELLFNVVKHAGVREAKVSILADDKMLELAVEDRGTGFSSIHNGHSTEMGKGLGLFGIEERLRDLDGELYIASTPGVGSRVMLRIPIGKFPPDKGVD